jgi:hypothetical protein
MQLLDILNLCPHIVDAVDRRGESMMSRECTVSVDVNSVWTHLYNTCGIFGVGTQMCRFVASVSKTLSINVNVGILSIFL